MIKFVRLLTYGADILDIILGIGKPALGIKGIEYNGELFKWKTMFIPLDHKEKNQHVMQN